MAAGPGKPVLIVEGEKACDAARKIAGHVYTVVTWPNGSKAWDKVDWRPVYGRRILVWPDADPPGNSCALHIAALLHPHCPEVKLLDVADQADGYDAADAREEGCDALVLGHHREDILETFFMNFFHGGRLAAMPPKLLNDEGDLMVLRPLAYAAEDDLAKFATAMQFPIIPCDLCGSQDGLQRNAMKAMLADIETRMPGRKDAMLRALGHTNPSHLLDPKLFDFSSLETVRPHDDD